MFWAVDPPSVSLPLPLPPYLNAFLVAGQKGLLSFVPPPPPLPHPPPDASRGPPAALCTRRGLAAKSRSLPLFFLYPSAFFYARSGKTEGGCGAEQHHGGEEEAMMPVGRSRGIKAGKKWGGGGGRR